MSCDSPRDRSDVRDLLSREGFSRAEALADLARPCLVFRPATTPSHGVARVGGWPRLRPDRPWPTTAGGAALSCLAEIDLGSLAGTAIEGELPREGTLTFFYETHGGWKRPPGFAIVHSPPGAPEREPPPEVAVLEPVELRGELAWSLPNGGSDCPFLDALDLDPQQRSDYRDFRSLWRLDFMPEGVLQLLGYAEGLDDPHVLSALETDEALRQRWLSLPVRKRARLDAALAEAARRFRLCLEVADCEQTDLRSDGAPLSFLVHRQAWEAKTWSQDGTTGHASVILQRT